VQKSFAYAYLPIEHAAEGTHVEIEYFGERHAATISKEPLFDPRGLRLRV
jgi:glycine cleavage system aminomethyltransferase T